MTKKIKINSKYKNLTNKEKAKIMNVSVKTVVKYFAEDREDYIKNQALRRAEMYKLKQNGLKLTEIADRFNVTKSCVSHLIKKHKERYDNQVNLFD